MEKSKRLLTLLAITAALTISTVALAINGNWLSVIPNLEDLTEVSHRVTEPFILENLPDYFEASVIIEGSGYTEQPHTVDITISHTRPDSSVWLASGTYSLDLELSSVLEEPITSGVFTDLRLGTPYTATSHSWTPSSSANTYDLVLSLDNIVWTILTEYTIMSNAVQTAYAGAPIWWDLTAGLTPKYEEIYNTYTYMPGETIELSFKFHITGEIPSGTRCTSYTYNVVIERVGGGDAFTAVPSTTETGDWGLGAWMVHYHNITAPGFGEWFATVHVSDVTWTP